MAGLSNYPFVLAPGMGLNAYFAYTVVLGMGYSWQVALAAVFVEGIIFIILSITKIREAIFNCIPHSLKLGVTCGIGLFIAFIGLQNSKLVQANSSTLVSIYPFKTAIEDGSFRSVGIGAVLTVIGVLLIAILMVRKVKGAILFGIFGVWILGIIFELTGLYLPNAELGMLSLIHI